MVSVPPPDRTSFAIVPIPGDLSQYSISDKSQMATATCRPPPRVSPAGLDHPGACSFPPLPHPSGSPQRPAAAGYHDYDFEGSLHPSPALQPFVRPSLNTQEAPIWNGTLDGAVGLFETGSYTDQAFTTACASSGSYFPVLSPLATHLPSSEGFGGARLLPNPLTYPNPMPSSSNMSPASGSNLSSTNSNLTMDTENDDWSPQNFFSERSTAIGANTSGAENMHPTLAAAGGHSLGHGDTCSYSAFQGNGDISLPSLPSQFPLVDDEEFSHLGGSHGSLSQDSYPVVPARPVLTQSIPGTAETSRMKQQLKGSVRDPLPRPRIYRTLQPQPPRTEDRLPPASHAMENRSKPTRKQSPPPARHPKKLPGRRK